jgi:molybdate transport system substrate-binding protein
MRTHLYVALCSLLVGMPAAAVEISTLAGAAVQGPLLAVAESFRQQTGHTVKVEFDTVPNISRRIASGATADVLIGTSGAVDQAIKDGRAVANSRAALGRIGVGVAVSRGATRPDVSTVDALKAAILGAAAVVTSQGTSGIYVMKMLGDLGVLEQVETRTVQVPSGVAVMERLGTSRNEIGFTMISEVMYGEAHGGGILVGPLPRAIQNFTGYDAAIMTASTQQDVARQFIRALTSAPARKLFSANGFEVPGVRAQ